MRENTYRVYVEDSMRKMRICIVILFCLNLSNLAMLISLIMQME